MKVKLHTVLKDELDGGSIKKPNTQEDMTLGYAIRYSLLYGQIPAQIGPEEHMKRVDLADKLKAHGATGEVDLTAEEIVACKHALAQGWKLSGIVGQCCKILEGK